MYQRKQKKKVVKIKTYPNSLGTKGFVVVVGGGEDQNQDQLLA